MSEQIEVRLDGAGAGAESRSVNHPDTRSLGWPGYEACDVTNGPTIELAGQPAACLTGERPTFDVDMQAGLEVMSQLENWRVRRR